MINDVNKKASAPMSVDPLVYKLVAIYAIVIKHRTTTNFQSLQKWSILIHKRESVLYTESRQEGHAAIILGLAGRSRKKRVKTIVY